MKPEDKKIEPFIPVPRFITEDVANGKMTYREYELYIWMRLHTNIYGIATEIVSGLLGDLPHFKSEDNISKFLRSLRSKKYISYPIRQGRRGSFEIRFYDWLYDKKEIRPSGRHLNEDKLRSLEEASMEEMSEVSQNQTPQAPTLNSEIDIESIDKNQTYAGAKLRSHNNDTDTEHKIENYGNTLEKPFRGTLVKDFSPTSPETSRCREIAEDVKETYINPLLSVLNKDGLWIIEKAWGALKEDRAAGKHIRKSEAAYLMGIINKLRQSNGNERS